MDHHKISDTIVWISLLVSVNMFRIAEDTFYIRYWWLYLSFTVQNTCDFCVNQITLNHTAQVRPRITRNCDICDWSNCKAVLFWHPSVMFQDKVGLDFRSATLVRIPILENAVENAVLSCTCHDFLENSAPHQETAVHPQNHRSVPYCLAIQKCWHLGICKLWR